MAICPKCDGLMEATPSGARMACPNPMCPFDGWDVPEQGPPYHVLFRKVREIGEILNGEGTPTHKLAEIELIYEDD